MIVHFSLRAGGSNEDKVDPGNGLIQVKSTYCLPIRHGICRIEVVVRFQNLVLFIVEVAEKVQHSIVRSVYLLLPTV